MTTQLPLPFADWQRIPARHVDWFALANAASYELKHSHFYPFKNRFLKRFAAPAGCDLQVIVKRCWCGDGIWRGSYHTLPEHLWEPCFRCSGTGVYETVHIVLSRWDLGGRIFHCPEHRVDDEEGYYQEIIRGLIVHECPAPARHAERAFFRLLLRYEPLTLWNILTMRMRHGATRLRWYWLTLRSRMERDAGTQVSHRLNDQVFYASDESSVLF